MTALADAGEPERGRSLLDEWPANARDARYWRLRGRWDLEYDHRPLEAAKAFRAALAELPQDWRSWYRLARALRVLGREDESREAAETVSRIREVLDTLVLGPRLAAAVDHLDDASTLNDLATLSTRAGLVRLGQAWLAEAQSASERSRSSLSVRSKTVQHAEGARSKCAGLKPVGIRREYPPRFSLLCREIVEGRTSNDSTVEIAPLRNRLKLRRIVNCFPQHLFLLIERSPGPRAEAAQRSGDRLHGLRHEGGLRPPPAAVRRGGLLRQFDNPPAERRRPTARSPPDCMIARGPVGVAC